MDNHCYSHTPAYMFTCKLIYISVCWLFGVNGISTTVTYLMPNLVYIYAKYIGLVNTYFVDNIFSKLELICLHAAE